jgi:16S rRNA (cytosine1402-N4)-methyltransferase
MNSEKGISAADVLNQYAEKELSRIFWEYGELKNARKIAETILKKRQGNPIKTTFQLIDILKPFAPKFQENKFFAVVFQALRIEVNQELEALRSFLAQTPEALNSGGRLVVMSYHSLEDRLVKNFMKAGNFEGEIEKDFYGNPLTPFKKITGKPIIASEEELQTNSRARSAKLRIAEKK